MAENYKIVDKEGAISFLMYALHSKLQIVRPEMVEDYEAHLSDVYDEMVASEVVKNQEDVCAPNAVAAAILMGELGIVFRASVFSIEIAVETRRPSLIKRLVDFITGKS